MNINSYKNINILKLTTLFLLIASIFLVVFQQKARAANSDINADKLTECSYTNNGSSITVNYRVTSDHDPKPEFNYHQVSRIGI